jgi:YHS domain-containing protein
MRIIYLVVLMSALFGLPGFDAAFADDGGCGMAPSASCDPVAGSTAVDAGNKICPVTGDKVDGAMAYEYENKIYNFCCPMCIGEFKKEPQKYIDKVNQELEGS